MSEPEQPSGAVPDTLKAEVERLWVRTHEILDRLAAARAIPDTITAPDVAALAEQARIPAFRAIDAADWPSDTARISAKTGVDYLLRELSARALPGTDTDRPTGEMSTGQAFLDEFYTPSLLSRDTPESDQ